MFGYWYFYLVHKSKIFYSKTNFAMLFVLYGTIIMQSCMIICMSVSLPVLLSSSFSLYNLFILTLCFLAWHGIFWFWIVTFLTGAFNVTGRKRIKLVAPLYLGKVHFVIYWRYLGFLRIDLVSGVWINWREGSSWRS